MRFDFSAAKAIAPMFHGSPDGVSGFNRYIERVETNASLGDAASVSILSKFREHCEKAEAGVPSPHQEYFARIRLLGIWGASGCPVVSCDSRWAAAATRTTIPSEFYEYVKPPWTVFLLRIPRELGLVTEFSGRKEALLEAFVGQFESLRSSGDRWRHWTVGFTSREHDDGGSGETRSLRMELSDLVGGKTPPQRGARGDVGRSLKVLLPLIGGVCMAFQAEGMARRRSAKAMRRCQKGRGSPFPTKHQWVVGRPVSINLTSHVRDYVEQGNRRGSPHTVQHLRRGHWANQPYGPRSSLRKLIFREPTWVGPEDAPIAVRPHVLKGEGDGVRP